MFLNLIFLLANFGHSSVGRAQYPQLITSVCRLEIENHNNKTICSGNLLNPTTLKTAAHCFHKPFKSIKVFCPGKAPLQVASKPLLHPDFSYGSDDFNRGEREYDMALLNLDQPLHLSEGYSILPKSKEESIEVIRGAERCFVAGYGVNEKNLQMGTYKESLAPNDGFTFESETLVNKKYYNFSVMPGDSGGSLLCIKNHKVYDLGTISGKDFFNASLLSPSFKIHSFTSLLKEKTRIRDLRVHTTRGHPNSVFIGQKYRVKTFSLLHFADGTYKSNVDNAHVKFEVLEKDGLDVFGVFTNGGVSDFYVCDQEILCSKSDYAFVKAEDLNAE